jgi:hypothetical protein
LRPRLDELEGRQLLSLAIEIRYDYDTSHFFDTQAKRDLMQQVADQVGAALNSQLAAISPSGSNTWTANFVDPTTGQARAIDNLAVPADALIVYVGGRALSGSESGQNNTLVVSSSAPPTPFEQQAESRGNPGVLADPPTAYAPWGGSISFDNSHTGWYFGQDLSKIGPTQVDFVTVATHELTHLLGIGTSPVWQHLATPGGFIGPNAEALNGGKPLPLNAGLDHWNDGTASDGTWALMDPASTTGRRTALSDLDYAGLEDIGWSVSPPSRFQFADFTDASGGAPGSEPPVPEYTVNGSDGTAVITVTRVGPADQAASVHYETFNGIANSFNFQPAAVAGTSYTPVFGVLNFAAGQTTQTFKVPVADDHFGLPEAIAVALGDPSTGSLLGSLATATLVIRSQSPPPPPPPPPPPITEPPTIVNSPPTVTSTSTTTVTTTSTVTTSTQSAATSQSAGGLPGPTLQSFGAPGSRSRKLNLHVRHLPASGRLKHVSDKAGRRENKADR